MLAFLMPVHKCGGCLQQWPIAACRFAAGLRKARSSLGSELYGVALYKLVQATDFVKDWRAQHAPQVATFGDQNAVRTVLLKAV